MSVSFGQAAAARGSAGPQAWQDCLCEALANFFQGVREVAIQRLPDIQPLGVMFNAHRYGGSSMHLELLTSAPRALATLARDNSNLSALVLVLGVVGGCMLSAWREHVRERKTQFARRPTPRSEIADDCTGT